MIRRKRTALLLLLLAVPIFLLPAQTSISTPPTVFIPETAPQWVKDLRRWEIVVFGSFPFTMFTATFAMDMYRWANASDRGLDFSDAGRRYAPWPLKSAGAIAMDSRQQEMTIVIAAGLSIGIAFTDLIIVQAKRQRARRRAEALPVGTTIIIRSPWPEGQDGDIAPNEEAPDQPPETP